MFESHEFEKPLAALLQIMRKGDETHFDGQWKTYPAEYHIVRAMRHLELLTAGDAGEDHLGHAACRLLLAMTLRERS